jgi:hypothetical protein
MKFILRAFATLIVSAVLLSGNTTLQADVVWDEGVSGDLATLPGSPTPLIFANGLNTVIASVSEPGADLRDYMTFTIGPNQVLTAIILDAFSPAGASFHAINAGSTGFIPGDDPSGNFLGLELVFDTDVGMDLLPGLAAGAFGSTGFTVPLGPGTYTYLFQELTQGQSRSYQLSFNVVPEPSSTALLILAGLAGTTRFRRRVV